MSQAWAPKKTFGGKLVKMPINAEHSSLRADSMRARQLTILRTLDELQRQLEEEREARIRYQAQSGLVLTELEEALTGVEQAKDRLRRKAREVFETNEGGKPGGDEPSATEG